MCNLMLFYYFILLAFCFFCSVPDVLWDTTWLLINLLSTPFICSLPLSLPWKEVGTCIILIVHWAIEFPVCCQDLTWEKTGLFLWVKLLQISPFAVLLWTILINSCEMANKPNLYSALLQWEKINELKNQQENQIKILLSFMKWWLVWVKFPICQWVKWPFLPFEFWQLYQKKNQTKPKQRPCKCLL